MGFDSVHKRRETHLLERHVDCLRPASPGPDGPALVLIPVRELAGRWIERADGSVIVVDLTHPSDSGHRRREGEA